MQRYNTHKSCESIISTHLHSNCNVRTFCSGTLTTLDYGKMCNLAWVDPPLTCDDYEGQKAGGFDNEKPVANRNDRTDVEGCCWWGRGKINSTLFFIAESVSE